MSTTAGPREVRAPRGTELTCKGWPQEAALRMLMNNLDPEVAERPDDLVVYGGTGRAARSWEAFDAIVRELRRLEGDETLLVQSGKPVGVVQTHEWAPRVLIANSNLVPEWATWDEFRRLEALGLTMYGQMTAGSWIYIGTQGILQGTYETFAAIGAKRLAARSQGTISLTAGLGGMGGAQPLAVTMNDGVVLCVDVDPSRIERRVKTRYLDVSVDDVDEALRMAVDARDRREPLSIGVVGNAADVVPRLAASGAPIDIVTDQTSAHDPLQLHPAGAVSGGSRRASRVGRRRVHEARAGVDGRALRGDGGVPRRRRRGVRLRQQPARRGRARRVRRAPSHIRGSSRPTSGRCSAKARARSGGRRCRAIRPTSRRPTARSWRSSLRTKRSRAGSGWRATGSPSRACPRGSAGSGTGSGTASGCGSTTWSLAGSSGRRS